MFKIIVNKNNSLIKYQSKYTSGIIYLLFIAIIYLKLIVVLVLLKGSFIKQLGKLILQIGTFIKELGSFILQIGTFINEKETLILQKGTLILQIGTFINEIVTFLLLLVTFIIQIGSLHQQNTFVKIYDKNLISSDLLFTLNNQGVIFNIDFLFYHKIKIQIYTYKIIFNCMHKYWNESDYFT